MMVRREASSKAGHAARLGAAAACIVALLTLPGCSDMVAGMSLPAMPKITDLNPWAEKEQPLPGKRIEIIQQENIATNLSPADRPIALPPPRTNDSWSQPGGVPSNAPGHLALNGNVKVAWTADAGKGSSFFGKVTASPIVADGKVFTLDAAGRVTAFNASTGATVWTANLTPPGEKDQEGFGGGIAADGGRLYAGTGFGLAIALDLGTGKKLWEKNVGSPIRSSPTASAERVFIVNRDGQVFCLSGSDGSEIWSFRGMPERASILANQSPAVDGDFVIVPYPTGDVVALSVHDGRAVWSDSLSRSRTASSLAAMSDASRPAVDRGFVFVAGHAGRTVANTQRTGERMWSLNVASIQPPAIAGDTVFVVDTGGQLMAISRAEGKIQWTAKLPGGTTWSGPVLAGNHLWAVSEKGNLVSVDAMTGRVVATQDMGAPVYIAPVVAGGRMFILTDKARLIALN
jgi:outer membrane protein assembly factor BamB